MNTPLAWRNITHTKVRSALSITGIGFAIMLIFLQLGFYGSVLNGATIFYDQLDFDLVLVSRAYVYMPRPSTFPRQRLYQALALPEVERASPFYIAKSTWTVPAANAVYSVFVLGFNPDDDIFINPGMQRQADLLKKPDTILVDHETRATYGPVTNGSTIGIGHRKVKIAGQSRLGTAFIELALIVVSDLNFVRLAGAASINDVNVGLLRLKRDADPRAVAERLQAVLPRDTIVMTRPDINAFERRYWVLSTSTGLVFGSGAIVAFIVGMVIMYQTLSTQITRNLPEYATLKALGYSDARIARIVLQQSIWLALMGFAPGFGIAMLLYDAVRTSEYLPIYMTWGRFASVFALALTMATSAGLLSLRKVRRADPADLY